MMMNIVTTDYAMQTQSYDIFFSGCKASPKCQGCHNSEVWDFSRGTHWKSFRSRIEKDITDFRSVIKWIFILGGDPLDQDIFEFTEFLIWVKKFDLPLVLFTRNELDSIAPEMKQNFDYIKTGRYLPELTTDDNICYSIKLATSNQHVWKRGEDY